MSDFRRSIQGRASQRRRGPPAFVVALSLTALASLTPLTTPLSAQLVINELMAANAGTIEDADAPGEFDDWIELYNDGPAPVLLEGMYLTDDENNPRRWRIPADVAIGAGEHLVFWADDDEEQGPLHTNFKLNAGGEQIALYDRDGSTLIDQITFGLQDPDISYGRYEDARGDWCYLSEPTPGAPNQICRAGRPAFSRPGGTFTGAFELEITSDSPVADIYYTLDGKAPDDPNAPRLKYTGPITIDSTTWVRACVHHPDLPSSPIVSEAYLALDPELERFDSNLPIVVIDTFGRNIDAEDGGTRPFRPVTAVFIDTDTDTGRAAIIDSADYAGYGGMHVRGASTASYPKKQYAFETWDESGEDKAVSLLGFPKESDWILHAPYSDKTLMRNFLMYTWSRRLGRYAVRTRFVEVFVDRRGGRVSRNEYAGVYVFMEKIKRDDDRVDIEPLDSHDDAEPEITGGYLLKRDWGQDFFTSVYRDGLTYVDPPREELTGKQRDWIRGYIDEFEAALSGPDFRDPERGYVRYIDVPSFIDHHLLVETARNVDGFVLSTFMFKDRGEKLHMGPIWDYNGALGGANYFCTCQTEGWHHEFNERNCGECAEGGATFPADNPNGYRWYARLEEDPAFGRQYADRWFEIRQEDWSTERMLRDIDETVLLLTDGGAADNPVTRNFARWNILNTYVWPNFLVRGTYEEHVDWMKTWLMGRLEWMDLAIAEEYGAVPEFSHPGGPVSEGFELTITTSDGEIYYTLNGPDPRAADGGVVPEAVLYAGPITITGNTRVRARARLGPGSWSRMIEGVYSTQTLPLVVTEIMYNPPKLPDDIHSSASRYEFIELQNAGEETIDLMGVRLMRVSGTALRDRFDFSGSAVPSLPPGAHVVVARDVDVFRSRYGDEVPLAGAYSGTFNNNGDAVVVLGPLDELIAEFEYDASWYPSTDGEGHSLVLRDSSSPPETWSRQDSWRPSLEVLGSPGRADEAVREGLQRPGDINQDQKLNIRDAVGMLLHVFSDSTNLPCASEEGNQTLLDVNGDLAVDLTDAVHVLSYLFGRGEVPVLGTDCVPIPGCPDVCSDLE